MLDCELVVLPPVSIHPEMVVGDSSFPFLAECPLDVVGYAPRLLLGERGEQGENKEFLYANLRYRFINNNPESGLDLQNPPIEIQGEKLTCDEALKKMTYYIGDDEENTNFTNLQERRRRSI